MCSLTLHTDRSPRAKEPVVEAHGLRSLRGAARFWKHESLRVFSKTLASLGSGLILRVGGAAGAEAELLKIWQELGAPQDGGGCAIVHCVLWGFRFLASGDRRPVDKLTNRGVVPSLVCTSKQHGLLLSPPATRSDASAPNPTPTSSQKIRMHVFPTCQSH